MTLPAPDFGADFWARLPNVGGNVSRETVSGRLQTYLNLLRKWQAKMNLVSPDSLPEAPARHFLDSVQIAPLLLSTDRTLVDIGSGAGFPGLVLAMCRNDLAVHMVESDAKKCEFMKTVSRETGAFAVPSAHSATGHGGMAADSAVPATTSEKAFPGFIPATIHTERVEKITPFVADVMTARALASLTPLLDYAMPFVRVNPAMRLIFLKGEGVSRETDDALKKYDFDMVEYPSITADKARILVISNLRLK